MTGLSKEEELYRPYCVIETVRKFPAGECPAGCRVKLITVYTVFKITLITVERVGQNVGLIISAVTLFAIPLSKCQPAVIILTHRLIGK